MTDRLKYIETILQRLAESQAKTDVQLAKSDLLIAELRDAQLKTDGQLAKTDAQLAKTMRTLSAVGINLGDVAESLFYYALAETMEFGGICYESISPRMHLHSGGLQREFDIVMTNGAHVALIEIKHKLHINDVIRLMDEQLPAFRKLLPRYADCQIHLGVAAQCVPEDVLEYAQRHGIGVLRPHGKGIEMVAPPLAAF